MTDTPDGDPTDGSSTADTEPAAADGTPDDPTGDETGDPTDADETGDDEATAGPEPEPWLSAYSSAIKPAYEFAAHPFAGRTTLGADGVWPVLSADVRPQDDWYNRPPTDSAEEWRAYSAQARDVWFGLRAWLEAHGDDASPAAVAEVRDIMDAGWGWIAFALDEIACGRGWCRAGAGSKSPACADDTAACISIPDRPWGGGFEAWAWRVRWNGGACAAGPMPGAPGWEHPLCQ